MAQDEAELNRHLVSRARDGDLDAFNEIVDWYQGLIFRVCYRVLGNQTKAEDATQDTFIKAYTSLDQYHGGSFKSWLTRIATNRCYDVIRAERRRPAGSLDAEPVEAEPTWSMEPASEEPESYASRSQLSHYLETALNQLSEDQRVVVVLYDVHGYSYEEIAEIVDASLGTVKSRISRGRSRLREILRNDERSRELFDATWRQMSNEVTTQTGPSEPVRDDG